jgi:hypothetical protein
VTKLERKMISFFLFFQVMEHRWNETDTGKEEYPGKNLVQCQDGIVIAWFDKCIMK